MNDVSKDQIPKECLQKYNKLLDSSEIPKEIAISTITIVCKLKTSFNRENIRKYIDLSRNGVLYVSYGNKETGTRTILKQKKKRKKRKKKTKNGKERRDTFFNQVTVKIIPPNSEIGRNPVNIKIFENGSLQVTGCRNMKECLFTFQILFRELRKIKAVAKNNIIVLKPFATNINNIHINKVYDLNIHLINTNFNIGFDIDREKLYNLLNKKEIYCKMDLGKRASVDIYYKYKNKKTVSIFVFRKGNIIITGGKTTNHIREGFKFITKILYENYKEIKEITINKYIKN